MVVPEAENILLKLDTQTDSLLTSTKNQLDSVLKEAVQTCKSTLITENAKMKEEIQDLKKVLVRLEGGDVSNLPCEQRSKESKQTTTETCEAQSKPKVKVAKPAKNEPSTAEALPVDVGRLDFRIGHILEVEKHPDADSLYVEKVEVGEAKPRTVVSGLVKHMSADDLRGKMVVLLCNLKPAKMRGTTSEAMVMCASTPEKVEVLVPPEGCVPGDTVEFDCFPRNPDVVLNPKKKVFETCAPDLRTDGGRVATYKGVPFVVPGKGKVLAPTMADVQIK